ncbi:MAG: hypothetical protein AAGJ18_20930 [Bacteroidota bacterium]
MSKYLFLLIVIVNLPACKEKTTPDIFSQKVYELAQRYEQLGRFSGTILIAKDQDILFHQSFGLADYELAAPFTDTSIFKIGQLTELFTDQLNIKGVRGSEIQEYVEEHCHKSNLKRTFYQKEGSEVVTGYLYHPVEGKGLTLEIAPTYDEQQEAFWKIGLKSTALDLFQYTLSLPDTIISKSGYLKNDGFSFALHKTKAITTIILSNRRHPVGAEMTATIQAIYDQQPYHLPLPRLPFDINDYHLLSNYTGIYQMDNGLQFKVITRNDSLLTILNGQETHVIPQSNNQFYYQDFDAGIRFVQDTNQIVIKATLLNGFMTGIAAQKVAD